MSFLYISDIGIVVLIFFIGAIGVHVLSGILEIKAAKRSREPVKVQHGIRRLVLGLVIGITSLVLAIWMMNRLFGSWW